jgi:hypothetical protein
MRFMVMHYETQAMDDGILPSPEEQAAIGQYLQEAAMSGVSHRRRGRPELPGRPGRDHRRQRASHRRPVR